MKNSRFFLFFLTVMLFFLSANITAAATYQETVLRDAPVVYYRFESADGDVIRDLSGNGRDGMLNGNASLAENSAAKGLGKCLLLRGGDDAVRVNCAGGRKLSFAGRKITIEMWMLSTGGGSNAVVNADEWQDQAIHYQFRSERHLSLAVGGKNPEWVSFDFHSVAGLQKSRWNHLVMTYDGTLPKDNVRFYANGLNVYTTTIDMLNPAGNVHLLGESFTVGNYWDRNAGWASRPFVGMLDEVAIYDKALTPAQIRSHYLAAGEILQPNLNAVRLTPSQEQTTILSQNAVWSYVFTKPAQNWTKQFPLPKSQVGVGAMSTSNRWPKNMPYVWMTTKLTLPEDYTPGNLHARVQHDDNVMVFINGTPVYQQVGTSRELVQTKFIQNPLVPGENIIAVYCENTGEEGLADVTLLTDGLPPLGEVLITPMQNAWSYTFDDPGAEWIGKFPLPRSKSAAGPFVDPGGLWQPGKGAIWMTQVVTLPANYVPEELFMQYTCDIEFWMYVNGVEVSHLGHSHYWQIVREIRNTLKPGKNIIAVRVNRGHVAMAGVELYTRKYTAEEKAEMKKNPLEHLQRPPTPEGVSPGMNEAAEGMKPTTLTEKKIQLGLNCLKLGQTELGITTLEKAAEEDEKDFTANCILGMYAMTKQDNSVKALTYFAKCVKVNAKDPSVLNNYGVAAMENKRFSLALESWERLAKIDPTLPVLAQNVGCMMDLLNKKRIVLKEPEQLRLVELYILTCANQNRDRDPALGFMLLPPQSGVGHRPDCDSAFVQEFKRGKETVTCQPFEVKKTYYGK